MDDRRRTAGLYQLSLAISLVSCLALLITLAGCAGSASSGERVRLVITPVTTPTPTLPVPPTIGPSAYTVRPGDTLSRIASQFGITVDDIVRANNIADPNTLAEGQVVTIPAHSANIAGTPGNQAGSPTVPASPALPPPDVTPPLGPTAQP